MMHKNNVEYTNVYTQTMLCINLIMIAASFNSVYLYTRVARMVCAQRNICLEK